MEDMAAYTGGNLVQVLGGAAASIIAGYFLLKNKLSKDSASQASDAGFVDTINRYQELLNSERKARQVAEERADKFARELRETITAMGELKAEISGLRQQVESQSATIESLRKQLENGK